MEFEEIQAANELFNSPGEPRSGTGENQEALIRSVQARFPDKGFCIVQQRTIVRAIASDGISPIHALGHLPIFVFAEKVILDSRRRSITVIGCAAPWPFHSKMASSMKPKTLCTFCGGRRRKVGQSRRDTVSLSLMSAATAVCRSTGM
jgi:hypothetical protein